MHTPDRELCSAVEKDVDVAIGLERAANFPSEGWLQANLSPYPGDCAPEEWRSVNYRFFCRTIVVCTAKALAIEACDAVPNGRPSIPSVSDVLYSYWPRDD